MAVTSIAAESSSTRCAICARPARRGATLCAQCKAAVKRARQVPSVHAEFLPQPGGRYRSPSDTPAQATGGPHAARRAARVRIAADARRMGHLRDARRVRCRRVHHRVFRDGRTGRGGESRARFAWRRARRPSCDRRNESAARAQPPASPSAAAEGSSADEAIAQIEWTRSAAPPARSPGASPARKPLRDAEAPATTAPRPIDARSPVPSRRAAPAAAGETVAASPDRGDAGSAADPDPRSLADAGLRRCRVANARIFSPASSARSARGCSIATGMGRGAAVPRAAPPATTRASTDANAYAGSSAAVAPRAVADAVSRRT